jgi:hypothetical protein
MSEKEKKQSEKKQREKKQSDEKIMQMVDQPGEDGNRFAYRPPNLKAKAKKDTEEKGYAPPKKPRRPTPPKKDKD